MPQIHQPLCRLCRAHSADRDSHALPNAAFREALRQGSGKAVVLVADDHTPNRYSSDSGSARLLCGTCESLLNDRYDRFGAESMRAAFDGRASLKQNATFLKADRPRLRMYLLSLLWRMSISPHSYYDKVNLPQSLEELLRVDLLEDRVTSKAFGSVFLTVLGDGHDVFEAADMKAMVFTPFPRVYKPLKSASFCFVIFGYMVEIFLRDLPSRFRRRPGVISGRNPVFVAPYSDIWDVPELVEIVNRTMAKHTAGLDSPQLAKRARKADEAN